MSFSRVLFFFLASFIAYFNLTLSNLEPQDLNRQLVKTSYNFMRGYSYLALAAASAGLNFMKMPNAVTQNCTINAKAIMVLFSNPSTYQAASSIIDRSVNKTIKILESHIAQNLIELICNNLNEEAQKTEFEVIINFEATKQSVQIPDRRTSDFMAQIPREQNVSQYMKSGHMIFENNPKELIQFGIIRTFHSYKDNKQSDEKFRKCRAVATAIHLLSKHKNTSLRTHIDKMFQNALTDFYFQSVYKDGRFYYPAPDEYAIYFADKLDQYIIDHAECSEEYKKIKKKLY